MFAGGCFVRLWPYAPTRLKIAVGLNGRHMSKAATYRPAANDPKLPLVEGSFGSLAAGRDDNSSCLTVMRLLTSLLGKIDLLGWGLAMGRLLTLAAHRASLAASDKKYPALDVILDNTAINALP